MRLRQYLKSFGIKDSFFSKEQNEFYSPIELKNDNFLGFKSQSLLGKVSLGNDFLNLKDVFPKNKKIQLQWIEEDPSFYGYNFYFEGNGFEDAIDTYRKAGVEIERSFKKRGIDNTSIDDEEYEKILIKNKLIIFPNNVKPRVLTYGMNEAYFHHEYNAFSIRGNYNHNHTQYFCIKENKDFISKKQRIFFLNINVLSWIDNIDIQI